MIRRALLLLVLLLFAVPAQADDNRPLTVTIEQQDASDYSVTWKIPANIASGYMPVLKAPQGCAVAARERNWADPLGTWRRQDWHCKSGLAGQAIAISWPQGNPNLATIARYRPLGDEVQTQLLQPSRTRLTLPSSEEQDETASTFLEFLKLGFEHIWEGVDHLLFVTGLIIIAGSWRRIFVTITGFTVAHSITLGLSALDLVRLPIRAVEAVIALSIVFLAVEIAKGPRDSLTWRRPVAVAASFGLLHGFGFAAVLREVGLPQDGLLAALFAFNIGIEIGQVIFAGLLFALLTLVVRRWKAAPDAAAANAPQHGALAGHPASRSFVGYALGIIASYWLVERLVA